MKIALIVALVFNFLLETLAAVSLIAGPGGLGDAGQGGQWSMHYGFAALAIASSTIALRAACRPHESTVPDRLTGCTGLHTNVLFAADSIL